MSRTYKVDEVEISFASKVPPLPDGATQHRDRSMQQLLFEPLVCAIAALRRGDSAAIEAFHPSIIGWLEELKRYREREHDSVGKTTGKKRGRG